MPWRRAPLNLFARFTPRNPQNLPRIWVGNRHSQRCKQTLIRISQLYATLLDPMGLQFPSSLTGERPTQERLPSPAIALNNAQLHNNAKHADLRWQCLSRWQHGTRLHHEYCLHTFPLWKRWHPGKHGGWWWQALPRTWLPNWMPSYLNSQLMTHFRGIL